MDNNRDYIERRNRIYAAGKRRRIKPRKQWNSSLFFLRLNICLGLAVIVIMASYIDTAPTEAFCEGVNKLIGENMSVDDVKNTFEKMYAELSHGNIPVMAKDSENTVTLDPEIKEQINQRTNSQKKTETETQ